MVGTHEKFMKCFIKGEGASKRINQGILKVIEKKTWNAKNSCIHAIKSFLKKLRDLINKKLILKNFNIFIALTIHDEKYTWNELKILRL